MIKLPQKKYDIIEQEIKKVSEDLIHFPEFIELVDKIIEDHYGKYSVEANTLFRIQEKHFLGSMKYFSATGKIKDPTETMRETLIDTIKFLKTLKP